MKKLEDIHADMAEAMSGSYDRNQQCLDDYEFAIVEGAMWKGAYASQFANKPKPEINQIFGSINRLLGQKERLEMNAKITSCSDDATDDDAELLQSLWRNDFGTGNGSEAVNNSDKEAFFSGFGAYKLVSKYEDEENPDPDRQYLSVEPIMSAASSVVFGPSVLKDKSDCTQSWHIVRTSRKMLEDEYGGSVASVGSQQWFDWNTDSQKDVFVAHYYETVIKTITTYDFGGYIVTHGDEITDEAGNNIEKKDLDSLKQFNEFKKTTKKSKCVEYALISGDKFLIKARKTPFKRTPIIPQYGYYSVINGIEHYCGEVRKRRDPQMFMNAYYSSLMEIMSAPQVEKPEYAPEQIARHRAERERADIDGAAFILSDPIKNPDGTIAHFGPIGRQVPPSIGTGLAAAGQQLQTTLLDMSGTGASTVPSNAAADAIRQVNERQDDTFQPLMQNSMAANRAACTAWIDAAKVLYFTNPRRLRAQARDGRGSMVETMQYGMSGDSYGPYKNSARGKYSVQVKIGETHKSRKEAELETTLKMLQFADSNSAQGQLLLNQAIISTTGEGGDRARKIANYQMIDALMSLGLDPDPDTQEEQEYVQRKMQELQNAQQQEDPNMVMAQAEMLKGQADMLAQQNKQEELRLQAAKAGAEIQGKRDKLESDLAVASNASQQNQQRIDNERIDRAVKNGIEISKLENQFKKDISAQVLDNSMQ